MLTALIGKDTNNIMTAFEGHVTCDLVLDYSQNGCLSSDLKSRQPWFFLRMRFDEKIPENGWSSQSWRLTLARSQLPHTHTHMSWCTLRHSHSHTSTHADTCVAPTPMLKQFAQCVCRDLRSSMYPLRLFHSRRVEQITLLQWIY